MHPPGYIQEGQETIFGYLLLGVYHRKSPGCTLGIHKSEPDVHIGFSSALYLQRMDVNLFVSPISAHPENCLQ
jgi:hypothetical protein